MKRLAKLLIELILDFVAILMFLGVIVTLVYVIIFIRKHEYRDMATAFAALIGTLLLDVGFSFLSAGGDKKRFSQKIVNNFWINLLPPW